MTNRSQLTAANLSVEVAGRRLFSELSLTAGPGDRIGLVGPNGAGKSSLLRALAGGPAAAGAVTAAGAVSLVPADSLVVLLDQERDAQAAETVLDYLARRTGVAAADRELTDATNDVATQARGSADRYDLALQRWLRLGVGEFEASVEQALTGLGLDAGRWMPRTVESCSGGERARIGLAAVELTSADVVLLDEPTNDLDAAGLAKLEALVTADDRPRILVSHDRRFLSNVVNAVLELNPWEDRLDFYRGSWDDYQQARKIAAEHAKERFTTYVDERDRLTARARTERAWSAQGVSKAKASGEPDKFIRNFAIESSENGAAKARRTEKALERLEEVDKPWEPWQLQFSIGEVERSGDLVASLADATIEQGSFTMGPVDVEIHSGDRVRIVGPNGSGKTTLIRALFGELAIAAGEHRLGASVVVGRLDQQRLWIAPEATVFDAMVAETPLDRSGIRSLLAGFGLGAEHVDRRLATLSPGERTRLLLAIFQGSGVNTLILDEPTNHLDLPAVEQLESALSNYRGTLVMVTHDRAFAEAVEVNRTIELPLFPSRK